MHKPQIFTLLAEFLILTDAGRDVRAALLVAPRAPVAGGAGDAVLAGALAARLVARLTGGADRVAVARWNRGKTRVQSLSKQSRATPLAESRLSRPYHFLESSLIKQTDARWPTGGGPEA